MAIERCVIKDADGNIKRILEAPEAQKLYWENVNRLDNLYVPIEISDEEKHKEWSCKTCNKVFIAPIQRDYCHNPCTDPEDKLTRSDIKLELRECELCKKQFMPTTRRHIYCNNPCKSLPKKSSPKLNKCKLCKKTYVVKGKEKYCGNPCNRYMVYWAKLKQRKLEEQ